MSEKKRQRFRVCAVHEQVRETAVEMAHEFYSALMQDDMLYEIWKKRHPNMKGEALENQFVKENLSKFIPQARTTLTLMLQNPSVPEEMKASIHEALVLDSTLKMGWGNAAGLVNMQEILNKRTN